MTEENITESQQPEEQQPETTPVVEEQTAEQEQSSENENGTMSESNQASDEANVQTDGLQPETAPVVEEQTSDEASVQTPELQSESATPYREASSFMGKKKSYLFDTEKGIPGQIGDFFKGIEKTTSPEDLSLYLVFGGLELLADFVLNKSKFDKGEQKRLSGEYLEKTEKYDLQNGNTPLMKQMEAMGVMLDDVAQNPAMQAFKTADGKFDLSNPEAKKFLRAQIFGDKSKKGVMIGMIATALTQKLSREVLPKEAEEIMNNAIRMKGAVEMKQQAQPNSPSPQQAQPNPPSPQQAQPNPPSPNQQPVGNGMAPPAPPAQRRTLRSVAEPNLDDEAERARQGVKGRKLNDAAVSSAIGDSAALQAEGADIHAAVQSLSESREALNSKHRTLNRARTGAKDYTPTPSRGREM